MYFFFKPRPNNRNISTQQNGNIVGRKMLRAFGHHVATCCEVLRHVESSWLKFETGQIVDTKFVDVA